MAQKTLFKGLHTWHEKLQLSKTGVQTHADWESPGPSPCSKQSQVQQLIQSPVHPSLDSLQYISVHFTGITKKGHCSPRVVSKRWIEWKKSLDLLAKFLQPTVGLLTLFHKVNLFSSNELQSIRIIKPFFAKLLSAKQSPASSSAWDCSIPETGFSTWLCGTSFRSSETSLTRCLWMATPTLQCTGVRKCFHSIIWRKGGWQLLV